MYFDDAILDLLAKQLTRDVTACLDEGRKKIPDVPTAYDVGSSARYVDRGMLINLRITAGDVTERGKVHIPSDVLGANEGYNAAYGALVADTAAKFVMRFVKP